MQNAVDLGLDLDFDGDRYEPASVREFLSVVMLSVSLATGAVAAGCLLGEWLTPMGRVIGPF
jgi:hypothetical protein